jgi:hypothetical protein
VVAVLTQACSDNEGPAGPHVQNGQTVPTTGHAATAADIKVQVAVNPNVIEPDTSAGVTAIVTNTNGFPLAGQNVQFSTSLGTLNQTVVMTNALGQASTFLKISGQQASASQSATVTAFVDGATPGTATVTVRKPGALSLSPTDVTVVQTAVKGTCSMQAQFTASGGAPPYTFSSAFSAGRADGNSSITSFGLYSATLKAGPTGSMFDPDTVTVTDSAGAQATATVHFTCNKP